MKQFVYYGPASDDLYIVDGKRAPKKTRLKMELRTERKKLWSATLPGLYYLIGEF